MSVKRILIFFLVIFLLALLSIYYPYFTGNSIKHTQEYAKESAILERVIDGDTIVVSGEEIGNHTHIRLLGINTPEKKMPFSEESTNFLKQFLNQTLELQRDKEDVDMYKRKLRYLFYNGELINQKILENGFANTYYLSGLKYENTFLQAEQDAKNNNLGIWTQSTEQCARENCIILENLNPTEEFFTISNQCSHSCDMTGWFIKDAGRNTFYLNSLNAGKQETYKSKENKEVWNNEGDRLFLFDENGLLVLFYQY